MAWVFRVLVVLMVWSAPAAAQAPTRVALVIGNSTYANANRLSNPGNDTRLVANALRSAGFQTVDARSDLGVQAFRAALRDFRTRAAGAQVALVYYAGHGIEGNGKNWLIPTDAKLKDQYDLVDEAINLDQVMEASAGAALRVVILDACRDNPLGRSWSSGTRAVSRGLAAVEIDDVLVIYAAAAGQTAADGDGANSPFAASLARRLPEAGLPVQLLGGKVRDDVVRATGGAQRPYVSSSISAELIYLVGGSTSASAPSFDPRVAEVAFWTACCGTATTTAADFESYLSKVSSGEFPGTFRDVGRRRLEALNTLTARTTVAGTSGWTAPALLISDFEAHVTVTVEESAAAIRLRLVALQPWHAVLEFDVNGNGQRDGLLDMAYTVTTAKTKCVQYQIAVLAWSQCGTAPSESKLGYRAIAGAEEIIWTIPKTEVSSTGTGTTLSVQYHNSATQSWLAPTIAPILFHVRR